MFPFCFLSFFRLMEKSVSDLFPSPFLKIKGNILLSAYYAPISAQELSIELGVAMPYLEDELRLLEMRQYLVKTLFVCPLGTCF